MKPLLAGTAKKIEDITFPCYCTPKLDGIRCLIVNGYPVSRTLKEIRNKYVQMKLRSLPEGLDGELIIKDEFEFRKVSSAIMREDGSPDFSYAVFDTWDHSSNYLLRMKYLEKLMLPKEVELILPITIRSEEEFYKYEAACLNAGYEGIMVRNDGPYKFGRSSVKQGYLLKWKRFTDSEAEILEFQEQVENTNVKTKDNFGRSKRSSHKENMIPKDTLGALLVRDIKSKIEFKIGTGFDNDLRNEIWQNRSKYATQIVKYKSQLVGAKDKPRFPVFLGFRDREDM